MTTLHKIVEAPKPEITTQWLMQKSRGTAMWGNGARYSGIDSPLGWAFRGTHILLCQNQCLEAFFFYFMFLMGMIHSQAWQIRSLCSKSLKFSRVWLHKRVRNKLSLSVPTDFQERLAPGRLKLFRQQHTKIISSYTPPFSGICYLPNWQLEQKFCSFSSSDSSESSETATVCALALPASMHDINGITVPSQGEQEQKQEANPFLCPKGEMLCLLGRTWQGDWQYGLPGINRISVVCSLSQ